MTNNFTGAVYAEVTFKVGPDEVFDQLERKEQEDFIYQHLDVLSDEDLKYELQRRGYNVEEIE